MLIELKESLKRIKNNMNDVKVIIIAGGIGTRLWPVSTQALPKQFCKLTDPDKSLLQLTYDRALSITNKENIFVNTNNQYKNIVIDQLDIDEDHILFEPNGKNTGPIICLISNHFNKLNPESVLVYLWADHHYSNTVDSTKYINIAIESSVQNEVLHTIGIKPSYPHTGLGYIKKSSNLTEHTYIVDEFKEKPNLETAISYVQSGDYLWNSGTYIAKAKVFINEFSKNDPATLNIANELDIFNISLDKWNLFSSISIDYAITEKADQIIVVEAGLIWSDVGTWSEYENISEIIDNNILVNGYFKQIDSSNNVIYSDNESVIGLIGITDSIIIKNGNKVLISTKKDISKIGDLRKMIDEKYLI